MNRRESNSDVNRRRSQNTQRQLRPRLKRQPVQLPFTFKSPQAGSDQHEVPSPDEIYQPFNEVVVNKTVRMLRVSPLYKFKFEKKFLKDLARKINVFIQKENMWESNGENRVPGSYILTIEPLVGHDGDYFAGILIQVVQVPELEDEEEDDELLKVHFWGVLCRDVGEPQVETELKSKNLSNMPIFLVKGNVSLANTILQFFSKRFDCIIREHKITPIDLAWLGAMWSAYPTNTKDKALNLKYEFPEEVKGCDTLTLTIEAQSISRLWQSVHNNGSKLFLNEEKEAFIKSLNAHHQNHFGMKLDRLTLMEVETSSIKVHHKGKIKLFSMETAHILIQYFASLVDQTNF